MALATVALTLPSSSASWPLSRTWTSTSESKPSGAKDATDMTAMRRKRRFVTTARSSLSSTSKNGALSKQSKSPSRFADCSASSQPSSVR